MHPSEFFRTLVDAEKLKACEDISDAMWGKGETYPQFITPSEKQAINQLGASLVEYAFRGSRKEALEAAAVIGAAYTKLSNERGKNLSGTRKH